MPYKSCPTAAVEKMGDDLKNLDKKLKALEKAKGDKNQIAALKKEIESDSKAMGKKLDDDIGQVNKNSIEHFQNIDSWVGQCVGFLKTSKDALERFKKTGSVGEMMTIEGGPGTIMQMAKIATKDADEFGKSWFQYRTFNPTANGLDKKFCANFYKVRTDIMNQQKGYGAKIDRMEMLSKEAEGVIKLAKAAASQQGRDVDEARKDADSMRMEVAALLTDIIKTPKINFDNLQQNCDTIAKGAAQKTATKDHYAMLQSVFKNAVAIHKGISTRVKSIGELIKNGEGALAADELKDAKVKGSIDLAKKDQTAAKAKLDEATKLIAKSTKDLAAVGKIAK